MDPVSAAFGGSVSFGRFLSESLDWGKWSSFCQKRHLEEIEKCSTPGSVAQKAAYFEAHYKKKAAAARRSASSLEQANVSAPSNDEGNDGNCESCCNLKPVSEEFSTEVSPDDVDDIENRNRISDMKEHGNNSLEMQPLKVMIW